MQPNETPCLPKPPKIQAHKLASGIHDLYQLLFSKAIYYKEKQLEIGM